ncbi:uncharacterized protein LOC144094613 [Amblyomma americanum]
MVSAVFLFLHVAVALVMIARLLPVCVLGDTYTCAPYRDGNLVVHDEAVGMVWPLENRPSPFCRLVPTALASKCTTKNETGILQLPKCTGADANNSKAALAHITARLRALQEKPAKPNSAPESIKPANMIEGDCFYPYKVFDTDMTSACPLLTDELIGHWMALVLSAVFGMLGGLAAVAIAVIFLAIGKKKKKKRIVRKRHIKKKPKEKPTPPPTPPPPPPPPLPPPPVPSVVNIEVEVPTPVPVIIPQRRRRPRHHHCRPEPPIILVSSPPCSHPTPALMAAPLAFPPAVMPSMAMPVGAVSRVVASPIATSPAVSPALMTSPLPFASTVMPSMGVPVGAVSQVAAASVPTSPTISTVMMPRSPGCCGCDESSSRENFLGHTNANFCDSGVALAHVPNRSMVLAAQQPAYSRVLSPLRRAASLCTLRRSSVVHRSGNMPPATMAVLPGRPLVRRVPGAVQPLVSRRVTYAVPRRI